MMLSVPLRPHQSRDVALNHPLFWETPLALLDLAAHPVSVTTAEVLAELVEVNARAAAAEHHVCSHPLAKMHVASSDRALYISTLTSHDAIMGAVFWRFWCVFCSFDAKNQPLSCSPYSSIFGAVHDFRFFPKSLLPPSP
eukprot:3359948-Rhodomonas_salina.1